MVAFESVNVSWRAAGAQSAIKVHDLRKYPISKQLSAISELDSGILFCTYSLLVKEQSKKGEGKSRLEQIVEWCGRDFDGVLAFDEAHKAKVFAVVCAAHKVERAQA